MCFVMTGTNLPPVAVPLLKKAQIRNVLGFDFQKSAG